MANIFQLPLALAGSSGVFPTTKYMVVGDDLSTVTTPGYLSAENLEGFPLATTDILNILYSFNPTTQSGTFGQFAVTFSNGQIVLVTTGGAGDVTLPTTANHIATYTNTNGHLAEDPATAISGGNIQAGLSGTAGRLTSFPSTAARGSLSLAAVANTGNTATVISNNPMGQASTINIPDPGNAVGQLLVAAGATPFVSGNIPVASGTAGKMVDSGKSAAGIPSVTTPTTLNHIATYTDTNGDLGQNPGTAITSGNIQAGSVGAWSEFVGGSLILNNDVANTGVFEVVPTANSGNFAVELTNDAFGQASQVHIPDPGNAQSQLLIAATTTPFVDGNFPMNVGTAGKMMDSGIPVDTIATTTNVVLLDPGANQTIITGNLDLQNGSFVVGNAGGSGAPGEVILFNTNSPTGNFTIAVAATPFGGFSTTLTTDTRLASDNIYVLADSGLGSGTPGLIPVISSSAPLVSGNVVIADLGTNTVLADSGIAGNAIMSLTANNAMADGSGIILAKVNGTRSEEHTSEL